MRNNGWALLSTATVLLLLACFFLRDELIPREYKEEHGPGDFLVFYVAGMMSRTADHKDLYYLPPEKEAGVGSILWRPVAPLTGWSKLARTAGIQQTDRFLYPPFAAVFFSFLTWVSPPQAVLLWRAISFDLILFSIFLILTDIGFTPRAPTFLICALSAVFFFPVTEMLSIGQVGALILFLWTLGIHFQQRKQTKWSALAFALGAMIKVTPVLVVGVFLIRRQWKWVGWFAGWSVVFAGIGLWHFGWHTNVQFLTKVLPSISCGMPWYLNKSLSSLLTSIYLGRTFFLHSQLPQLISPVVCLVNKLLGLLLFVVVLLCFAKRNNNQADWSFELAIIALVSLAIAPVSWRHHFVLAILPILYLWLGLRERVGRVWITVLALATLIIGTPFPDYAVPLLHNQVLGLISASLTALACLSLIALSVTMYPQGMGQRAGKLDTERIFSPGSL